MALPTLDATFASAADLPRRQMLARWLVGELGSGSVADYWLLPERYLWAKIAVAAGATLPEANYISLPKQYVWKAIYDAVSGSSLGTIDWTEKQALGHIAAAYRGDTASPANLATYIDWPWRYKVASIIGAIGATFPSNGLLAFWKLDDETDASDNGNTLTNNNVVTFVAGIRGNAASLSKANGSYLSSDVVFNTTNTDFSVSTWVKIQPNNSNTVFLGTGTAGAWGFNVAPDDVLTFTNAAVLNLQVAGFVRDVWNHVVAKNEGGAVSLYLNGVLVDSGTWDGYQNSPDVRLQSSFSDQQGDLLMDATGLWNRALTEAEILLLYADGTCLEP
jgi:hypothetical protein